MIVGISTECGVPIVDLSPSSERRVRLRCDACGAGSTTAWHNYRLSQTRMARGGKTICRKCANAESGIAKRGRSLGPRDQKFVKRGSGHPSWKGGTFVDSCGYEMQYVARGPGRRNHRKVHTMVAELMLGRPMRVGEVVHHIDGDKLNNAPTNLVVLASEAEHRTAHASLERAAMTLVREGLVLFDSELKIYRRAK